MKKNTFFSKAIQQFLTVAFLLLAGISNGQAPTITSFTPSSGAVGSTVTITGTGFNTTAANNVVYIGGLRANVTAATSTSLIITVPNSVQVGQITVINTSTKLIATSPLHFRPINNLISSNNISPRSFSNPVNVATVSGNSTWYERGNIIAVADFNNDGKIDIAKGASSPNIGILKNNCATLGSISSSDFSSQTNVSVGDVVSQLDAGDINGDGKIDLLVGGFNNGFTVVLNTSSGSTITFGTSNAGANDNDYYYFGLPYESARVKLGDVNGDGKLDVICSSYYAGSFRVFLNTSTTSTLTFSTTPVVFTSSLNGCRQMTSGDVNGDGKADILLGNDGTGGFLLFLSTSSGNSVTFQAPISLTGNGTGQAYVADVNGDGKIDIIGDGGGVFVNQDADNVYSASDFTLVTGIISGLSTFTGISDFNGNGKIDLIGNAKVSDNKSPGLTLTSGNFVTVGFSASNPGESFAAADLDGDNKQDYIASAGGSSFVDIVRNKVGEPINFYPQYSSSLEYYARWYTDPGVWSYSGGYDQNVYTTPDYILNFDLAGSTSYTIYGDLTISSQMKFYSAPLDIGYYNLTTSGTITGLSSSAYIKTSSSGLHKQAVSNTPVLFGIGNTTYNPLTITNNSGNSDVFGVRVESEVRQTLGNWWETTLGYNSIQRLWSVTKTNANGGSGVTIVFNWNASDTRNGTVSTPALFYYNNGTWTKITTGITVSGNSLTLSGYTGTLNDTKFAIADATIGFAPPPTISSFTPTSAVAGSTITLTGTGFTGSTAVTIGGTAVTSYTVVNSTSITAVVGNATNGTFQVTTPGGTATSSSSFTFTPSIVKNASLTNFTTCAGTASTAQTFTVTGSNLSANISIAALTGYEYSLNGTTYSSTLSIAPTSGTVASTTVYVRLTNSSTGTTTGNISISSTNATTQTIAVTGIVSSTNIPTATTSYSICLGDNAPVISATASTGHTLQWYTVATGGTASTTVPTPGVTTVGVTTYYVSQINNTTNCESPRSAITVTVYAIPAAPTATSTINYCLGATPTAISATAASGSNLQWYTSATGGTASTTAPIPTTTTIGSTVYYVSQKANTGAFVIDNAANSSYANYVSNIGQTFSTNSNIALTSITLKEAYFDYSNANTVLKIYNGVGGTLIATANSTYVNPYSGWISNFGFSFANQNIILTSGQTYYFEIVSTSTMYPKYSNAYANGSGYVNGSIISQDFAFKLDGTISGNPCESPRTAITVNVNAIPTISGVQNMTVGGSTLQLTGSGNPASSSAWVSSNTSVATISATGEVTAVASGNTTITYTTLEGCSITASITVYVIPASPTATTTYNYCVGATPTALSATALSGNSLQWYTVATGGTGSTTIPTVSTTTAGTTTYYVSQKANSGSYSITTGNNSTLSSFVQNLGQTFQVANNVVLNTINFDIIYLTSPAPITLKVYNGFGGTLLATANSVYNPGYYHNNNVPFSFTGQNLQLNVGQTYYMELTCSQNMYVWLNSNVLSTGVTYANGVAQSANDFGFTLASTLIANPYESPRTAITVNVNAIPTITGAQNMTVGGSTLQLTGSGNPAASAAWTSSNTAVATISATGEVTAIAGGNSTITYTTLEGCSITATINVIDCNQPLGNALNFDGVNDHLILDNVGNNINFAFTGTANFTLEAWVNRGAVSSTYSTIISKQNSGVAGNYILSITPTGQPRIYREAAPGGLSATTSLPLNEWHHVAGVFDGTSLKIYIDGVLNNSLTTSGNVVTNVTAVKVALGASYTNNIPSNFFNGGIDEARIWNVARTATQIQQNYLSQLQGNETGLVGYYNFDQGVASGNNTTIATATNTVSSVSNGVLTNFAKNGSTSNFIRNTISDSPISGAATVCQNATAQYTYPIAGGTWTVSNGAVATVSNTGLLTTTSEENITLTYTYTINGCTKTATKAITIVSPLISGVTSVGAGETVTLTATTTAANSNAWVSATPAKATVSTTGVVSGLVPGTTIITYTNNNGCVDTALITVVTGTTVAPVLTSPATNTTGATTLNIVYSIPETPLAGSVRLTFTPVGGGTPIVWTMNNATSANFNYVVGTNPVSSNVTAGTALGFTTYDITLSYQDSFSNPAASVTNTNIQTLAPPLISFVTSSFATVVNSTLTINTINTGGSMVTYSISPALPSGFSFNTSTGVVTGSSSVAITASNFTVTATNAAGSDTESFTLAITADTDGDGIPDIADSDVNGDGVIDNGPDTDGDGIIDQYDNDIDGDGIPNNIDNDADGDGVPNAQDVCSLIPNTAITAQPSTTNQVICPSASISPLTVTATGPGLTYQWYRNTSASTTGGTLLSGATSASYTPLNTVVGTAYYYVIVSGTCGNATSNVSGSILVTDVTLPTVVTQNKTIYLNAAGQATITAAQIDNGSTDNCAIATRTLSQTAFNCAHVGSNTVTLTVTDVSGNIRTGNATVTVIDSIKPTVVTQNITVNLNASGQATITAAQINNGSSDNCGIASVTVSQTAFTCANTGANTVTLTVTDVNGNVKTNTATVTVVDNTLPTVVTQNAILYLNASGQANVTAAQINNGSYDNCGIATMTLSQTAFTCAHAGVNTVTLTVTDTKGNSATGLATVTVIDNTPPVAVAQNINAYLNAGGAVTVTPSQVGGNSTDNCSIATMTLNNTTFNCSNLGPNPVTLTVVDPFSNVSTANATITVVDSIKPILTIPADITVNANSGCGAFGFPIGTASATDNCSVISAITNNAPAFYPVGITNIVYSVTDGSGNTKTKIQKVTVIDNVIPVISAPANIVTTLTAGCTVTSLNLGTPVTTDNCTIASVTNNAPTAFPVGTTTVTWTVTDASGNTATATQTVTVTDAINPTITAPAAITVNANASCVAFGVALGTPVTADNCSVASVTNNAPAVFPIGATTVTWTVTDASGNTATATQTVTVVDNTAPLIFAPAGITANISTGCTVANLALGTPVTMDNCSTVTVSNNAPTTFPTGVTTVTWTATDGAGNTATATQVVTIVDNTDPTIVAPAAVTANLTTGCTATGIALGTPTTADNCTVASVTNNAPATYPIGTTIVTWTVTDGAGNTATTTQLVTITDNTNPTITAPAAITATTNAGCTASGIVLGAPVTADNCTVASVTNNAPTVFPIGTTTITWVVTDGAGNATTATQLVTITDAINPTITAPANIIVNTNSGCTATGIALGSPVTADNCSVVSVTNNAPTTFPIGTTTVTWVVTDGAGNTATATQTVVVTDVINPTIVAPAAIATTTNSGCVRTGLALGTPVSADNCTVATVTNNAPTTFPLGTTTVTWTVTDGAGNTATATQTVVVTDIINPTITAPAAIAATTNNGCTATGIVLGTPITADNCTVASVTNNAPTIFPIGTTTVTWTVTDGAGNATTATQVVTVTDGINPTIAAPVAITVTTNSGCEASGIALGAPVTADNCTVASVTNNAPAIFPIGTTTVTWTVTDAAGNTATAAQTITVVDNINPAIIAPAAVTFYVSTGCSVNSIVIGTPVTTDNCTVASITNNAPATFPIGTTTVTWTVTDGAGNTAVATQEIQVIDTIAPTAAVTDVTVALGANGTATVTGSMVDVGSFDNCGIDGVVLSQSTFGCDDLGTNVVQVTITDDYGNSTVTFVKVTVTPSGLDVDMDGIDDACDEFVNTQIVQVPSGFSPNGDHINDTFVIPALDQFTKVQLQVYNKYGHEVYISAQYKNDWDGTSSFNGLELPDDTYFYILNTDGELRQGYVYINRIK